MHWELCTYYILWELKWLPTTCIDVIPSSNWFINGRAMACPSHQHVCSCGKTKDNVVPIISIVNCNHLRIPLEGFHSIWIPIFSLTLVSTLFSRNAPNSYTFHNRLWVWVDQEMIISKFNWLVEGVGAKVYVKMITLKDWNHPKNANNLPP